VERERSKITGDESELGEGVSDVVEALILDLLEWVAKGERSYEEVMNAWRTSCPRLPVWEDANDRGLIARQYKDGREVIKLTPSGLALLEQRRPPKRSGMSVTIR
jgi:hypothetical protein